MVENLGQFEKNVSTSFSYVKKDLIMINDAISELHDKIQHLSMNNAALMGKIAELENRMVKKAPAKSSSKKKVKKGKVLYD